jgi:hypothetical protein
MFWPEVDKRKETQALDDEDPTQHIVFLPTAYYTSFPSL